MRIAPISVCILLAAHSVSLPAMAGPDDARRVLTGSPSQLDAVEPTGNLSLEEALDAALRLDPGLSAAGSAVHAAEARVSQAGRLPNPGLELETEDFGGRSDFGGFRAAETTALISQPVLLGGKRGRRRELAAFERTIAGRDLDAVRLDVIARTSADFFGVYFAQERAALSQELLDLARALSETVNRRVEAGKVSPVEATRARIPVALARVEMERAASALAAARVRLPTNWGSVSPAFERVVGPLPQPAPPARVERLRLHLAENPDVARLADEARRQEASIRVERATRIPDITVSVGTKRLEEVGQTAWAARFSVPLPVFDRNQGNVRAAEHELERARLRDKSAQLRAEAALVEAVSRLNIAYIEVRALEDEVVPAAAEAFAATEIGYREGKFGFLEVLDAQRALFEARARLVDSLETFYLTRTELERLIGRRLEEVADNEAEADTESR